MPLEMAGTLPVPSISCAVFCKSAGGDHRLLIGTNTNPGRLYLYEVMGLTQLAILESIPENGKFMCAMPVSG